MCNALDEHVDSEHWPNHIVLTCRYALSPFQRFPPDCAKNDQGQEQIWAELGGLIPSLNHRMEGRHRFYLFMIVMIRDIWRETTSCRDQERRVFEPLGQGYGHGAQRHARNSKLAKEMRAKAKSAEVHSEPPITTIGPEHVAHHSKRQRTDLKSGRIELPAFMFREFPRGFVTSLSDRDKAGRAKYMTVPITWFIDYEKELLALIRTIIPPFGVPTTTQKFRAKMSLQQWMATKLKIRYDAHFGDTFAASSAK